MKTRNAGVPQRERIRLMCQSAMFMALIALTGAFSIPAGMAHIYLTDVFVCTAALLLPPVYGCAAGALGAFLGDMMFYPQAMLVTLITRFAQCLVIETARAKLLRGHRTAARVLAAALGAVIMVCGYTLGHMLMYGAAETAFVTYVLPQVLQAAFGAFVGTVLCTVYRLGRRMSRYGA